MGNTLVSRLFHLSPLLNEVKTPNPQRTQQLIEKKKRFANFEATKAAKYIL